MTDALIASLRRAVLAAPDDVPLRLHLAELLVLADRRDEAVLPPDRPAREAILRYHLRGRPVGGVDVGGPAGRTEGWTGADLAVVCESAADRALLDSARTGTVRMIETADLEAALGQVHPSARTWFDTARIVARSANGAGYDELSQYLKRNRPA